MSLGAVLALATQWDTYQAVVYRLLFDGPRQLAAVLLFGIQPNQSSFRGDVFDGLQRAFDDLTGFANGYAAHSAPNANPLLGGTGLGALLLTAAGSTLLLSTLGVILACKIVLGLLLGLGRCSSCSSCSTPRGAVRGLAARRLWRSPSCPC